MLALCSLAAAVNQGRAWQVAMDTIDRRPDTAAAWSVVVDRAEVIFIAQATLGVATSIVFLWWLYLAVYRAKARAPMAVSLGPRWAVFAWLVPVANLWLPPIVVFSTFRADSTSPGVGRFTLVTTWWVLALAWPLLWVGGRIVEGNNGGTWWSHRDAAIWFAASNITLTLAAILMIVIVAKATGPQYAPRSQARLGAASRIGASGIDAPYLESIWQSAVDIRDELAIGVALRKVREQSRSRSSDYLDADRRVLTGALLWKEQSRPYAGGQWVLLGLLIAGVGYVITALSYSESEPGGHYLVFYGPVLVGAWFILRGALTMFRTAQLRRQIGTLLRESVDHDPETVPFLSEYRRYLSSRNAPKGATKHS